MIPVKKLPSLWRRLVELSKGRFIPSNEELVFGVAEILCDSPAFAKQQEIVVACLATKSTSDRLQSYIFKGLGNPVQCVRDIVGNQLGLGRDSRVTFLLIMESPQQAPGWVLDLKEKYGSQITCFGQTEGVAVLDRYPQFIDEFGTSTVEAIGRMESLVADLRAQLEQKKKELGSYENELKTFASPDNRRRSQQAWKTMLAETQHKLRTCICDILVQAEILKDIAIFSEKGSHEVGDAIVRACSEASSRLGSLELRGKPPIKREKREILEVKTELNTLMRDLQVESNISIGRQGTILLDLQGLRDILRELVQNARYWISTKNNASYEGRITVEAKRTGAGAIQSSLEIVVEDNGPGVHPDAKHLIFYPTMTFRKDGTGEGLAIVHRYCLAHDGEVCENGEFGVGARFVLRIPFQTGDAQ
jgi:signal transduction histidine kinase